MAYPFLFYIFAFFLGAVIGSFLNVCICRLPENRSVIFPPSHCPKCDYRIPFYDNIPILSYLLLGGKCRSCKTLISIQYPLVELINGNSGDSLFNSCQLSPAQYKITFNQLDTL
jgi:leader peptidase (prepilin peptidase)/N-methyltransferase